MNSVSLPRLAFIDWMKVLGLFVIVYGHCAQDTIYWLSRPIYPKQFGVAFFFFVMGYSLARETHNTWTVVTKRSFEIMLFGIFFAIFISAIKVVSVGDLNESNYLPFFFGINVLFNFFPANPSTWFIGTFLHFLILWGVFLRGLKVAGWLLLGSLFFEITVRAILMVSGNPFIAYMIVPNWITVFLLGTYVAQSNVRSSFRRATIATVVLAVGTLVWCNVMSQERFDRSFPFYMLQTYDGWVSSFATSVFVSFLYFSVTLFIYMITCMMPRLSGVEFFARNTLLVFIMHMPLYYLIGPEIRELGWPRWQSVLVTVGICFVGLAVVSECIRRLLHLKRIRVQLIHYIQSRGYGTPSPGISQNNTVAVDTQSASTGIGS